MGEVKWVPPTAAYQQIICGLLYWLIKLQMVGVGLIL